MFCRSGQISPVNNISVRPTELIESFLPSIGIAGDPRSFKTTLIYQTLARLRSSNIQANFIEEPKPDLPKTKDDDYLLTRYSLAMGHKITNRLVMHDGTSVLLVDRDIYDRIAWLYSHFLLNEIDEESFKIASNYFVRFYGNLIDGLIICRSNPELSMKRDGDRSASGPVMTQPRLRALNTAYKQLPSLIAPQINKYVTREYPFPIIQLDSTEVSEQDSGASYARYSDDFIKSVGTITQLSTIHYININV